MNRVRVCFWLDCWTSATGLEVFISFCDVPAIFVMISLIDLTVDRLRTSICQAPESGPNRGNLPLTHSSSYYLIVADSFNVEN